MNLLELLAPPQASASENQNPQITAEGQPGGFELLLQQLVSVVAEGGVESLGTEIEETTPAINCAEPKTKPKEKKSASLEMGVLALLPWIHPSEITVAPGTSGSMESNPETCEGRKQDCTSPIPIESSELSLESLVEPEGPVDPKPPLTLKDFDLRKFEFKTEFESAVNPASKLTPVLAVTEKAGRSEKESLPGAKTSEKHETSTETFTAPILDHKFEPLAPLAEAAPVERIRPTIEPPPPPPVARQVSMEIGEADSQVNVTIRERNGELAVHFDAASERLRENLQNAAPFLMHQLHRESTQTVRLDFSNFGSATDAGRESQQDERRKKSLKSDAVFAGVDEFTYSAAETPSTNPL